MWQGDAAENSGYQVEAMTMADKPTGSETLVLLRFGESEIVAPFHERHDFKPGNTLNLRAHAARPPVRRFAIGERP